MESNITKMFLGLLRLSLGFTFLWAFVDKLFGLGFATTPGKSWLAGGSPTTGFLSNVQGPFANFYHGLAGSGLIDWLFMLGLLFIGVSLTLGIFVRLGGFAGILMLLLMYSASFPLDNNPFIDDHIIYALATGVLIFGNAGKYFGLSNLWSRTSLVQKYSILR